ncbi:magnesium transporter CorA family protein [Fertoebacter nigrum]|uniref:Magnesium transport protein CorA n=1 Tax=Fertoeibacter niger TaxID=2656921 RepID=A0A8X8KM55_9RHOB|nr:magnesium transporter CorA family protein [Fertoeibacter niger]NUB43565.1 magnesium transporter CorA family protein [Fertoeibacter niger]
MLYAYSEFGGTLVKLAADAPLDAALWADLYQPTADQAAAVASAFGVDVPTLEDMEEIEISNRLYRENGVDYMTVVLPGFSETKTPISGPVSFIIAAGRLVTVRHHAPRPFETYPSRADKVGHGCAMADEIFLGLMEEIIGRMADLLEGIGRGLDEVSRTVFTPQNGQLAPLRLQVALERVGREGDLLGRVRLALLTLERAVGFFLHRLQDHGHDALHRAVVKALLRDIAALEVHGDFLSNRIGLASDATLGMINLQQNSTVRIVSVVAVLFLPPTLIASIYGMNFAVMPELAQPWGYPMALGLMVAAGAATYLFFKWKKWL